MSGMDTLMTDGLVIAADTLEESAAVFGIAELLEWHSVGGGNLPDADMTVLMWVEEADGATDWYAGWWDGEEWHDASHGGVVFGEVTHWAAPEGPSAC